MRNLWRIISRLVDFLLNLLTSISAWVAVIAALSMVAFIGYEVSGRHIFFYQATGLGEQMAAYMLVAVTFMGAAYTFAKGRHVAVDLLLTRLKPQVQRIMNIFSGIIGVTLCVMLTWYSSKLVMMSLESGSRSEIASHIPLFAPQLLVPVGMGILALVILAYTIRLIKPSQGLRGSSGKPDLDINDSQKGKVA